jgi:ribosomal protein L7/L12
MTKFQVSISSISQAETISLLRVLRAITNLSLKDTKNLLDFIMDRMPCVLLAGIDLDVAEHIVTSLQEAGTNATIEESSLTIPLLLCPQANHRYRWSWLGRVRQDS